jgi:anti-sigma factor RsiW
MTCDEVRELLPEHLLGTLDGRDSLELRRHLRGCAACREERLRLEEGVSALSRAAHDEEPPEELERKVLATLRDEWRDAAQAGMQSGERAATPIGRRARTSWLAAAAAIAALAVTGSILWGTSQAHRADIAQSESASYRNLLATLGGKGFRVGTLQPAAHAQIVGQVVLYDGDPTAHWYSWGVLLVHAPREISSATATLIASNGRTKALPPLRFEHGEAHAWIVSDDLSDYDRLTITAADGTVLAGASIEEA